MRPLPAVASWTLAIIGLTNIGGSLYAGNAVTHYRSKMVLFWMYASRALLVIACLLAPKTEWTFYLFAAGLGFTWLATVPPPPRWSASCSASATSAPCSASRCSRTRSAVSSAPGWRHQLTRFGDYSWMWYADIALATLAALANLPIREAAIAPKAQPA